MKLGISTNLSGASPADWAEQLTALGCEAVVFPVDHNAEESLIDAYHTAADEHNLTIAEVGIWKNAISENEEERYAAMDYSINQLKLADRVRAKCCVNVAGSAGPVWDGGYRENYSQKTWDRTVRMIQEIIDEAKPQHTYFTVEPMPWMYPTGPEEYLRLMEAVNRKHFAVHMDIINMINSPHRYFFPVSFTEQCFKLLGKHIKSCHLKDVRLLPELTFQLKECACGEGGYCLEKYAELVNAANPDMPMIIEHLSGDEAYVESLSYVRERLAGI